MKAPALWLLVLALAVAAGYCAGNRRPPSVTPAQFAAADSALRDAKHHIAGLERSNHELARQRDAADSAIARHRADAQRSAERATAAEKQAVAIRAARTNAPAGSGASDSVAFYRAQLAAADRETELLRDALERRWDELAAKDSIERIQRAELLMLRAAADSAAAVLARVHPALERADRALARSEPRCRGPFGIPCPSRRYAFAGGVAGAAIALVLAR